MAQNDAHTPQPIAVEVAYATSHQQVLIAITVPAGATIAEVIDASGVLGQFPELSHTEFKVGVFAKLLSLEYVVAAGDRVEIYRPLCADPKIARRQRAAKR